MGAEETVCGGCGWCLRRGKRAAAVELPHLCANNVFYVALRVYTEGLLSPTVLPYNWSRASE